MTFQFECECGARAKVTTFPIYCWCGRAAIDTASPLIQHVGLGYWIAWTLRRVGITKRRYRAAKRLVGLQPTCRCKDREEWLDRAPSNEDKWVVENADC